ncbi:MAG: V-type ATPase subunit [Clostridiaceae bacterium]|nr:V-type ATPase subunit [Clostridiaceae bacterium]
MRNKISAEAYLYASGRIHAMAAHGFTQAHAERMIDAKTDADAIKVLSDIGITFSAEDISTDEVLAGARERMFAELNGFLPDERLLALFQLRYDYHNIKAAMKAPDNFGALYMRAGALSKEKVLDAAARENYDGLRPEMKSGIIDGRAAFARTGDPQVLDFTLDRAMYNEMLDIADEMGSAFVKGYVKLQIDAANLLIYVRTRRLGRGYTMLAQAMIPDGNADVTPLWKDTTGDSLENVFWQNFRDVIPAALAALERRGSISKLERLCDARVAAYVHDGARVAYGEAVALAYLYQYEAALLQMRMILAGRRAGLSPDAIRERLRAL